MDKSPLHVLIAEDNANDTELIVRELRRAGFAPEWQRVQTEAEFVSRLNPKIDIILSDYSMPGFSGARALDLVKERGLEVPFIIVSGSIGEETAVAAMQNGAADYLIKDRLTRLGAAVKNALDEKRIRDESRRTQQTFERLQRDYQLILNSAGEGICGVDLDGKISFANPKACEVLGWKLDELLGKPLLKVIRNESAAGKGRDTILECMDHGATQRVTNDLFYRKDGSSLRVDYVCAPIKDEGGGATGTIITFKDITEQFDAHLRLKLQEEQYRLLFEIAPNPMWVFDTKSLQILAVNQAAIAQYGYSREEFLQLNLKDLRPSGDVPELIKARALTTPQQMSHFSGQFQHLKKDGSIILVEIYSSRIVWKGVASRMVTAIDVTERKKAERRLRDQADIIDRAHDAIIIRNFEDRRITLWNKAAERLYGWSTEEIIGRAEESMFADQRDIAIMMKALVATGEYRGEIKELTKDGREIITDGHATLIRAANGTPHSILIICTDITEQKKLETQLLRAQRLESIGTLAGGVAHDLNNILTPILICAQTLHRDLDEEDRQSAVGLIESSARRGASIVKQVLTFARGVEGARVLITPSHLIEEMIDIARKTFPKSIEITSRYPEGLWSIEGDPTQLHQVLLNLSVNARDAMPDGGSLLLAAENFTVDEHYASMTPEAKVGIYVAFSVQDTGQGMSRATIEKIFDPFFTTKELGKGTGLGLSTAVGIVKSHGGFISVYSELGKGTTFKIFLPGKIDVGVHLAANAPVESLKGNGEMILVVDDEQPILQVTRMALEQQNYNVVTASDGPEALAIFAQQMNSIDVVLTDIQLPHMDGVNLIRTLKKMKPDLTVIASTGQGEHDRDSQLQALGVTHLLNKPYDTQKLLSTLRAALA